MEEKTYVPTAKELYTKAKIVQLIKTAQMRKAIIEQCGKAADEGKFEYMCEQFLTSADVQWFRDRGFTVYCASVKQYYIRWDEVEED